MPRRATVRSIVARGAEGDQVGCLVVPPGLRLHPVVDLQRLAALPALLAGEAIAALDLDLEALAPRAMAPTTKLIGEVAQKVKALVKGQADPHSRGQAGEPTAPAAAQGDEDQGNGRGVQEQRGVAPVGVVGGRGEVAQRGAQVSRAVGETEPHEVIDVRQETGGPRNGGRTRAAQERRRGRGCRPEKMVVKFHGTSAMSTGGQVLCPGGGTNTGSSGRPVVEGDDRLAGAGVVLLPAAVAWETDRGRADVTPCA